MHFGAYNKFFYKVYQSTDFGKEQKSCKDEKIRGGRSRSERISSHAVPTTGVICVALPKHTQPTLFCIELRS
jgi:hypothetical protein